MPRIHNRITNMYCGNKKRVFLNPSFIEKTLLLCYLRLRSAASASAMLPKTAAIAAGSGIAVPTSQ